MPLEVFEIKGEIKKIHWQELYASGINHIITIAADDGQEYKVYGSFPLLKEGQRIQCRVHRDYEGKLVSDVMSFVVEYNVYMLYKLLTMIRGVGNKTAKEIVDKLTSYRLARNQPLVVSSLEEFASTIEKLDFDEKKKKAVVTELRKFAFAEELYKIFGSSMAYKDVLAMTDALVQSGKYAEFFDNPYVLVDVFPRVNIRALDQYMLSVYNIDHTAKSRITALVKYAMYDFGLTNKYTMVDPNTLMNKVIKLSGHKKVKPSMINGVIEKLLSDGWLVKTDANLYMIHDAYERARVVAESLHSRLGKTRRVDLALVERLIDRYEQANKIKLSPEQREAVISMFAEDVVLVGGSAGTGKSTVTNLAFEISKALGLQMKILTPTGKAAARYSPEVGAQTIHYAIGWDGNKAHKAIAADVFVIDEASMVDLDILYEFLTNSNDNAKIVFVGDNYQLPPVGFAAPFEELIASKQFKYVELKTVFRQEGGLLDFIHAIRTYNRQLIAKIIASKLYDKSEAGLYKNLHIAVIDKQKLTDYLLGAARMLKNDFTVLMPVKNQYVTSLNTTKLNDAIVKELKQLGVRETKVICVENDYERNVFNGDTGLWLSTTMVDGVVKHNIKFFDRVYEYTELEKLRFIEPGYALTVHKSQGSEYDTVFVLLFSEHVKYFDKKMLYTAVSRAKRKLVLVTDMQIMESIDAIMQRRTFDLAERFGLLLNILTGNMSIVDSQLSETLDSILESGLSQIAI